jgi:DNA-binding XRE family transcriptional regulator
MVFCTLFMRFSLLNPFREMTYYTDLADNLSTAVLSQNPKYSYLEYSRNEYILARMDLKKTIYSGQYKTIIQNLKEARVKQGLTQLEVAKHFGVGQSFISKIESGQYRLDILQLQEFAKLYKKPLTSFLKEQ